MGNSDSRVNFRKAVLELTSNNKTVESNDEAFWEQFWSPDNISSVQDVFLLMPTQEIRSLREESPNNLATFCYKTVERLVKASEHLCNSAKEQCKVVNCLRILTRLLPYIFEDLDWRGYFWSTLPLQEDAEQAGHGLPLGKSLLNTLSDLLFCPDFTVTPSRRGPETHEDLHSIDSCEYIWEAGVGFAKNMQQYLIFISTELRKLKHMPKLDFYVFQIYRKHVLPMFTSLLNVVCAYDPVGYGMPYNYLLFADTREPLVQAALQLLVACLDNGTSESKGYDDEAGYYDNFFVNYLSRIHREEDFEFMLKGFTRLLNNPLQQTYFPNSCKRVTFHQELFVLFWKCCEYNKKFMYYVLKTSDVLDILVPVLYHLNDSRNDQSRVGLMHMGIFILLLLSGERNFGVRLNKPYTTRIVMDIPIFTGTYADLLIIVFHKLITTGNQRLQSLFDCLLTIIVNVSPYLKSMSMVSANKLLHLLEAFSTPWFLYASQNNNHLIFFILEIFNNIIQYQFDGNSNLIYTIIRKRQVFYLLSNLPADQASINKTMVGRRSKASSKVEKLSMPPLKTPEEDKASQVTLVEGRAKIPEDAKPGTLKATLAATPDVANMTEKSEANLHKADTDESKPASPIPVSSDASIEIVQRENGTITPFSENGESWSPTSEWVQCWKKKLPLQTIMRLLQVLVPQVEKICIDKGLTDESEILKFLQHGTLVGLLPVPHPILIRKYQANAGTNQWFRTYIWGVIYLRNTDPPIWYDTDVKLFEIQK
uniref:Uncharacterized protein n=1 Tax=Romanomermis culicivorax TaxID=13658 RepID=A0A915HQG4_ROMCU